MHCLRIPGSLPCLLRLLSLLFWALVPVCSLRSGICPCCTPDTLFSLPCCPGAGSPATASTGKMGSLCSRAWICSRAWTCSSWAAMGMKGVLGSSVPRLARALPLCGQSLGCHWERERRWSVLGQERLLGDPGYWLPKGLCLPWVPRVLPSDMAIKTDFRVQHNLKLRETQEPRREYEEYRMFSKGRKSNLIPSVPALPGTAVSSAMLLYWDPCIEWEDLSKSSRQHSHWIIWNVLFIMCLFLLDLSLSASASWFLNFKNGSESSTSLPCLDCKCCFGVSCFQWHFKEVSADWWAALAVFLLTLLASAARKRSVLSTVPFSSRKYRFHR